MLNGPTGPVGNFSLIDIAERQWEYIDQLLSIIHSGDAETVEPKISAFEDYEKRRIEAAQKTIFSSGCSSWYLDETGIPMTWPGVIRILQTPCNNLYYPNMTLGALHKLINSVGLPFMLPRHAV